MALNVNPGIEVRTTACLAWYEENDYEEIQQRTGSLLPYEVYKQKFEEGKKRMVGVHDEVVVVTITAEQLFAWAADSGLPIGPKAGAEYALAVVAGVMKAPTRWLKRH